MGRRKFGRSESIRILRECAKGRPQKEVAKDFGCCSRTIAKIVNEADECIVIDEDHGESDVDEEESAFARRSMRHKQNSRIMHPSRTRGRSGEYRMSARLSGSAQRQEMRSIHGRCTAAPALQPDTARPDSSPCSGLFLSKLQLDSETHIATLKAAGIATEADLVALRGIGADILNDTLRPLLLSKGFTLLDWMKLRDGLSTVM